MVEYTPEKLKKFEREIVQMFEDGKLRSPLHLSGSVDDSLEYSLIGLFKNIKPQDWVFSTYRSHYHALLKGVPEKWLKQWVLDNKSIHVMNKEHKIFTSAIVGGCLAPALGVALAISLEPLYCKGCSFKCIASDCECTCHDKKDEHVWCFVGDMTAETGVFHEVTKYARRNQLPITFIIEDNGLSTDTPTQESWGTQDGGPNIIRYTYKRIYPHYGIGKFVAF